MEIRIGITNAPRELSFESKQSAAEIEQLLADAFETKSTHLSLSDAKGRIYIVPTGSLAYVEIGAEESRRIGFVG